MEARGIDKLAHAQAAGKETYIEKHLFTQLKYQMKDLEQKHKKVQAVAIKQDVN